MLRQHVGTAAEGSPAQSDSPSAFGDDVDAVHVRNYDHAAGHSVRLTVVDDDGRVRLTERCYLAPGQSRRVTGAIEAGAYRLGVQVDGVDRATSRCRLDGSPARTAVVELGNGVVSVTEGADGLVPA